MGNEKCDREIKYMTGKVFTYTLFSTHTSLDYIAKFSGRSLHFHHSFLLASFTFPLYTLVSLHHFLFLSLPFVATFVSVSVSPSQWSLSFFLVCDR